MTRLTKRKLKMLIKEERQASKMYRGFGLYKISGDEKSHYRYLQGLLKKR